MNEQKKNVLVVKIIDPYTLAINLGFPDGIKAGDRFQIYSIGDEDILDPETRQNLGKLETIKGTGKVTHVQEKMSTLSSDMKHPPKKIIHKPSNPFQNNFLPNVFGNIYKEEVLPQENIPFDELVVGDFARKIQ
jgi:hypothetical protein